MTNKGQGLICAGGYLLLSLFFAGQLLCPAYSLYRWDTMLYTFPLILEQQALVQAGHWPLWASSFACGTPLLGNINAASLYPLRLLHWMLPMPFGYQVFLFAHVWLTLLCGHLFFRKGLRLSAPAAIAGALCFGAGGYARAMWDTHNFLALPWIALGLAAIAANDRPARNSFLGLLAWIMLILCGDTQAAALWVPVALAWVWVQPERRVLLRRFACVLAAGILLTAPQWWPALATHAESYRAGGLAFAEAVERSFHPVRLIELAVPHLFGSHDQWFAPALLGEGATRSTPWTASFHIGLFALLPVVLSLNRRRDAAWRWAAGLVLASLLLSFGRYLPGFALWQKLPVLGGFRYPEKYLLWTSLGLAAMAAMGWSTLARPSRWIHAWMGAGILSIIVACLVVPQVVSSTDHTSWMRLALMSSLVCLLVGCGCLLRTSPAWKMRLALAALLVNLLVPWYLERPLTSTFDPFELPPIARVIRESPDPRGRFLYDNAALLVPLPRYWPELERAGERDAVYQWSALKFNAARNWGLRSADGFSPLERKAMREYRLQHARPADGSPSSAEDLASFCSSTGVRWLYTTPERAEELRTLGLSVHETARWENAGQAGVLVYLGALNEYFIPSAEGSEPRITAFERPFPGRIEISLEPGEGGRVVVAETFDERWKAVDQANRPLAVEPMNDRLLAVIVSKGTTKVELTFRAF